MFNRMVVWLARSRLHRLVSKSIIILVYTGRRSGEKFAVPVNYALTEEAGSLKIWISSKRERVWWRNFIGGNDAELVFRGNCLPVELAAVTDPDQVAEGLARYLRAIPGAARYFGVGLDEDGQPGLDDIRRAAADRVMVYANLEFETIEV